MRNCRVLLTPNELREAAEAGCRRQVMNILDERKPAHGNTNKHPWEDHIVGCIGERVLSIWADIQWKGSGKFRERDVGHVEVRSSSLSHGRLLLHDSDLDDVGYALVVQSKLNPFEWVVIGWCYGREGKTKEYWNTSMPSPCYVIPQGNLRQPDEQFWLLVLGGAILDAK